jgi:hypothetical protein
MSVQPGAFVFFGDLRQAVSSLEAELFEYFHSRDPEVLMGLKAETPAWVFEAVLNRQGSVGIPSGAVHRLQEEVLEIELLDLAGAKERLGKNELELVAAVQDEVRTCFGAYADPVDVARRFARTICFYRDLEITFVKGFDEFVIELEQGFTTRAYDEAVLR